jgi:hypothetical protein
MSTVATEYTSQQEYAKFLKKKLSSEGSSGCEGCKEGCHEGNCEEECSCCPVGLVAIYNDKGQHLGCLTPNDAEIYNRETIVCEGGYVKLYKNSNGEFFGCVSEDAFADLYETINGLSS